MYFIKPYEIPEEESTQLKGKVSPEKEVKLFDRPETPRKTMRFLFALWFALYIVFETEYFKFVVTWFQYLPIRLTAQESAQMFAISIVVFTVFRGLNVFIGLKISIFSMLCYHYVILIAGTFLLFLGQNILSVMWVSSFLLMWGFSAMFAGIYTFIGQQLTMTNQLNTLLVLMRGLFTSLTPVLIGKYLDNYSEFFIFLEIFFCFRHSFYMFL